MPRLRRSLTRSTVLITSLPKLSNTSTFHIGSPSAFSMGVDCDISPFVAAASCWPSPVSGGTSFRLSTRLIAAIAVSARSLTLTSNIPTYLSIPQ